MKNILSTTMGLRRICTSLLLALPMISGYELVDGDKKSVYEITQKVAFKMMQFYPGNLTGGIPGLFGDPYYWWEAGAAFGALIDYWYYTGDAGYNDVTLAAMIHQVGPDANFMPPNQSKSLGNDDQGFWALSAMAAAERNFPNPPEDKPQWLALAQGVFNSQVLRWDTESCGGGLRWQIYSFNAGYTYKNTISNGCMFQLAARLARYTGNATYAEWAEKIYDWTAAIGLLSEDYRLFDGSDLLINCTELNHLQWSYNAGIYLAGSAYMYNFTGGGEPWRTRVEGILNATSVFFINDTMNEVGCESVNLCNIDQRSFKAYLSRFMALTAKMAPFTAEYIMPKLRTSAREAAAHCSYGEDGNTCGMIWTKPGWDGKYGVGEQMCALEVIQNTLVLDIAAPFTAKNGGSSKGDPGAGTGGDKAPVQSFPDATGKKDRIGAGLATALVLILLFSGSYFMVV